MVEKIALYIFILILSTVVSRPYRRNYRLKYYIFRLPFLFLPSIIISTPVRTEYDHVSKTGALQTV